MIDLILASFQLQPEVYNRFNFLRRFRKVHNSACSNQNQEIDRQLIPLYKQEWKWKSTNFCWPSPFSSLVRCRCRLTNWVDAYLRLLLDLNSSKRCLSKTLVDWASLNSLQLAAKVTHPGSVTMKTTSFLRLIPYIQPMAPSFLSNLKALLGPCLDSSQSCLSLWASSCQSPPPCDKDSVSEAFTAKPWSDHFLSPVCLMPKRNGLWTKVAKFS